ncbi:MAG: cytochrome c3 family protein [Desulfobacterales bacterium]|nr:cytochrome c3 family protein [Desulfobacterales bacterium]
MLFLSVSIVLSVFIAAAIYAGTTAQDVIKMENKAYAKHTKGIVEFSHKKHAETYGAKCGDCHHDETGKALELKAGDDVKGCIECHKNPGEIKGEEAKGLSDKDKRQYHANAMHDNCTECHKKFNKDKGLKSNDQGAAPMKSKCAACHPKKE